MCVIYFFLINFFYEQGTNSFLVLHQPNWSGLLNHVHDTQDLGKVKKFQMTSAVLSCHCPNGVNDRKQKEICYMDNYNGLGVVFFFLLGVIFSLENLICILRS